MRRRGLILGLVLMLLASMAPTATAAPQYLPELSYKFYPARDIVFVNFHNPYLTPRDNITVNMIVREGTGRNRVVAIGQAKLPQKLVLMPGEHTSTRVPIKARVVRDIPALAQFEFRIIARPIDPKDAPPDVVVHDSRNGISLEVSRDVNDVPFVMGFIGLNPAIIEETTAVVEMAILTFYDQDHEIVWSEILPINGGLSNNDSVLLWAKYEQASSSLVPDISAVEAKFVVSTGNQTGAGQ